MSKYKPLVSFIIPVHKKSPEVFEGCLKSLFDQSYRDIEIVCVFDGPDEELESVARKYPQVRMFCIPQGGAPKARNYGFEQSKGEIVSFWDADCFAKPEMTKRWVEEFESRPECDFVYSGYEFFAEQGGIESQEFDPYALTCQNYIATMFPMKRQIFPGFDENLKAAQDWDLWLTISKRGHLGAFIQGSAFVTEPPTRDSISGRGWNPEMREETVSIIKKKHGIPDRSVCIGSALYRIKALDLAKMVDGDCMVYPSAFPHKYKLVFNLGFNFDEIYFKNSQPGCVKVQYWLPWDVDALEQIAHKTAKEYIEIANKNVDKHYCNDLVSRNRLQDLGIKAEVLALPTHTDEAETELPKEFQVLFEVSENLKPLFKDLQVDLPYIKMQFIEPGQAMKIQDFSLLVSFKNHPTVDEGIRRFILNGRNIISNVQAPYCGYLDWKVGAGQFKAKLIEKIREARTLPFNKKAQEHYKVLVDPTRFRTAIYGLLQPELEVVA